MAHTESRQARATKSKVRPASYIVKTCLKKPKPKANKKDIKSRKQRGLAYCTIEKIHMALTCLYSQHLVGWKSEDYQKSRLA